MTRFEVVGLVEILGSGEGRCFAPYEAKDDLKSLPGRRFDPARRCWVVPARHVEQAKAIIRGYVDRLDVVDVGAGPGGRGDAGPFRRRGATESWADVLLASLPPDLRKPTYRALVRVLHPDAGGDVTATQTLTRAWERQC